MYRNSLIVFFLLSAFTTKMKAQDSSKIYFTTSVGLVSPVAGFAESYKASLALNSGIEYKINRSLYAQFVLDFNAVKYDQQLKDINSAYLFQNIFFY